MKPRTSLIWQYFVQIDNDHAKCKTCCKHYSRKGRTTTSLKGHLKSMHKEKYKEFCKLEEQRETANVNQIPSTVTPLQQAEKQGNKEEDTKKNQLWNTSHGKAKKMDDLIGEMIALQNLPFNFVEGIGFHRVMQTALPNYQLRGSQFFTDHICDKIYMKVVAKIGQMLKKFPKLSFTTDIWSEPCANTSLLSLTAHGITEDFTRIQIVLKCCSAYNRLIGDNIWDHFNRMLLGWDIDDEQLHCFIHDGGSNMARAMHMANKPDVNCTVRQLQQCVRSALEDSEIKDLIAKCQRISGHFIHSQIAHDDLIKIQMEQLNEPALRVIQDCGTRWSSTFLMVERLLRIKDSICQYTSNHSIPQISPKEWVNLSKIVAILNPFEEIMRILSDTKTCISSVIPLIHGLKHTLQIERDKSDTNLDFKNMIKKIIEDINSRFCDLQSNILYSLATYLDPRYKLKFFNEIIKEQVIFELLRLLMVHDLSPTAAASGIKDGGTSAPKKSNPMDDEPCTSSQVLPPTQSVNSNLKDMLKNSSDDEEEMGYETTVTNNNLMKWKSLINDYNKEKRLQLNEDPLMWWRYNTKFQVFAPIVRTYLSTLPCSVQSEQLLIGAGLNYESLRNLEGDKAAKLLFVKYNLPLLHSDK